jgi:hypothetical protein
MWGSWIVNTEGRPRAAFLRGELGVRALAFPASHAEIETVKVIATFCGVGPVVSLLLATYGLDISVGFF